MNPRLVIAAVAATLSLLLGFLIRANAEDWSRNIVRRDGPLIITTHFEKGRHVLLQDVGAVFLGFGVLLIALLVVQWVAEANRDARPPAA